MIKTYDFETLAGLTGMTSGRPVRAERSRSSSKTPTHRRKLQARISVGKRGSKRHQCWKSKSPDGPGVREHTEISFSLDNNR